MQAVILAAGMGSRLGKYTKNSTKCMVRVDGVTLLERIFRSLEENGIEKVIIVTGYKAETLKEFALKVKGGLSVMFIDNPDYSKTNNIYSLYLASEEMKKDDTLLFESDLIFDPMIVEKIIKYECPNVVTVSRFEEWMDGTVTTFDNENNVTAFIEKKNFSWSETGSYYKTVNIYKFSKDFFEKWYHPFLEAYIRSCGYNAYYEMVLKVIANISGANLKALDITGYSWYEIDTPQDLQTAQTIFGSHKLEDLRSRFGGYWRFKELNDYCFLVNPWFPDERLKSELRYNFDTLLTQYPSGRRVIDSAASAVFGIEQKYILTANGAAELIKVLMSEIQGSFYIIDPSFNEYINAAENTFIEDDVSDSGYKYDAGRIIANMHRTDNMIVINPDNPSGNFIEKKDMLSLLDKCMESGKRIIVDESFVDFADPDKRYTLINDEILEKYPCMIAVKSISKSYGVPGLRLGVMCSSDRQLVKQISAKLPIWNINSFAEYFLQICGKYSKDYINSCDLLASERKRFSEKLSETGLFDVLPSQANFLMCRLKKGSADEFAEYALSFNCLIKSLKDKKGCKEGEYIRLAIKTPEENNVMLKIAKGYAGI